MKISLPLLTIASASCLLVACHAPIPYISSSYSPNAQIERAWHRLDDKNIAVEQVRVVKNIDIDCAGQRITIPGEQAHKDLRDAYAAYWKDAFMTDMNAAGYLNQKDPKVKLYNLIDSVKIVAEPTSLQWRINMEMISSNGSLLRETITYNAPSDNLKNMREGCSRLALTLDKAVAWSILKTVSDPRFAQLIKPGLGYVPAMKATSITSTLNPFEKDDEEEYWKTKPNTPRSDY